MNRNCWTNSVPYGYSGRSADTIVLPVRIIMSPTCSSRFLVGKKTRSAALRTTLHTPPRRKPMACITGTPEGTVAAPDRRSNAAIRVCSRCCEGVEDALGLRMPARAGGVRRGSAAGRERAVGQVPGGGRKGLVPGEAEAREELRPRRDRAERGPGDDPGHRRDRARLRHAQVEPGAGR